MRRLALLLCLGCGPTVIVDGSGSSGQASADDADAVTSAGPVGPSDTAGGPTTVPPPTVDPETGVPPFETEGATACYGGGGPNPLSAPCIFNSECASGVCRTFSDAPPDPAAICGPAPDDCSTAITGTVRAWPTNTAGPQGPVRVVKLLEALTNPEGAVPLADLDPDAEGRVDGVTSGPVSAPIAIVAIVGGAGDKANFPVVTGLASEIAEEAGRYNVGTDIHEFWAVDQATFGGLLDALAGDPTFPPEFGETGGAIGIVRDAGGTPVAGAVVQPDVVASQVAIRYLTSDGELGYDATDDNGAFVLAGQSPTGEDFTAYVDGSPIASGTVGSANGVLFALALNGG